MFSLASSGSGGSVRNSVRGSVRNVRNSVHGSVRNVRNSVRNVRGSIPLLMHGGL